MGEMQSRLWHTSRFHTGSARNDTGNYIIKQAADVHTISTLSGDFALKWDDEAQMSTNAHTVLVSQLAKTGGFLDHLYADGYEWHALVTDFDLPARDVLPLHRGRGDCENIFDEMKNQWGWSGFTAHSLGQTALFAGLVVIAANLWNIFTRLGENGSHSMGGGPSNFSMDGNGK